MAGFGEESLRPISEGVTHGGDASSVLEKIFHDIQSLYLKTHSYHWNVVGDSFKSDHDLFETQYVFLWGSLDAIAERIRALGKGAPSTFNKVVALPFGTDRNSMYEDLSKSYEGVIMVVKFGISELEQYGDIAGADYLTELLAELEKNAWMINSSFKKHVFEPKGNMFGKNPPKSFTPAGNE